MTTLIRRPIVLACALLTSISLVALTLVASPARANGTTLYVATTGSDSNPCTSAQQCLTISHAVSVAPSGSTIDVAAGTYVDDDIVLTDSVTIRGASTSASSAKDLLTPGSLPTVVTTSGPGAGSVIEITGSSNATVALANLHVIGQSTASINVGAPNGSAVEAVSFDRVAATGGLMGINTTGSPIRGFSLTNSAVSCGAGAAPRPAGVIPTVADGVGHPIVLANNYLTDCGVGINAGNFAGFGTSDAVAGTSTISNNVMEAMDWSCIVVAMSFDDLQITGNTLTGCNTTIAGTGAIDLEALTPPTSVAATGNTIGAAPGGADGDIGIQIQNVPASPGNLARFEVTGNSISGLLKGGSSDGVRFGPTAIARAADDIEIAVTGNTLTGNSRGGSWQTNAGSTLEQNLEFTGNRIADNVSRGFSVFGAAGRTFNAPNNWWGCNTGPGTGSQPAPGTGCDSVGGITGPNTLNLTPFLVVALDPSPATVFTGEQDPIRVLSTTNSNDQTVAGLPAGTPITFGSTIGEIEASAAVASGVATSTLTAGFVAGNGTLAASLDNAELSRSVTVASSVIDVAVALPAQVAVGRPAEFGVSAEVNGKPAPDGSVVTLNRVAARSDSAPKAPRSDSVVCRATITNGGKGSCTGTLPAGAWRITATYQAPGGPVVEPNEVAGLSQPVVSTKASTSAKVVGKNVRFTGQTKKAKAKVRIFQAKKTNQPAKQVKKLRSSSQGSWTATVKVRSFPTYLCVATGPAMTSTFRVTKKRAKMIWPNLANRGDAVYCRR
ncbi:MAG: hypothetical protein WC054_12625 [Candidatus Nanopelagicales bacterium]